MQNFGETKHFHARIKESYIEIGKGLKTAWRLFIRNQRQDSVGIPKCIKIFWLFLSIIIRNCSGKLPFCQLEYIKNELRATVLQETWSALSIMGIESDELRSLSFQGFALEKVTREKVTIFKLIYHAYTVCISFTLSSSYTIARIMLPFTSILCAFLVFPQSRNIDIYAYFYFLRGL